ncbi:hypothetical protein ACHAXR_009726 [Thalassiosira sp. AJA248-18]
MFKPNLRFARSRAKEDDESDGALDISTHSSRYSRSALPGNEKDYRVPYMKYMSKVLFVFQLVLIFLFIFGTKYNEEEAYSPDEYMIYRDIMMMLLIGFGYLMTFLRKYGLGAVGFTMLLTALGMQLSIFMELFVRRMYGSEHHSHFPLPVTVFTLIDSEFFAAALMISYGAVIGRAVMVVFGFLGAEDVGGTLTIHLFGAYFGVSLAKALGPEDLETASNADARRFSDLMSLIGTSVLWVFWPSFVGATETSIPENEERCVLNCILALLGSTVATFAASAFLGNSKFDVVHIANSSLAGGVAVGSSARLNMNPGGAVLLGFLAGSVSVFGYFSVTSFLKNRFDICDTCGVHNLHGLPAVLGGLASAVFVSLDSDAEFLTYGKPGQAWRQLAATAATIGLACASGYFTGFMLRWTKRDDDDFFEYDDSVFWWEGEFYENVNTVDEEGYDGTSHELSLSAGKAFPPDKPKEGATVAPDVPLETA